MINPYAKFLVVVSFLCALTVEAHTARQLFDQSRPEYIFVEFAGWLMLLTTGFAIVAEIAVLLTVSPHFRNTKQTIRGQLNFLGNLCSIHLLYAFIVYSPIQHFITLTNQNPVISTCVAAVFLLVFYTMFFIINEQEAE